MEGVTRASAAPADPLAELSRLDSADALVRWAIAALPHRSGLDEPARVALDAAFRARAEALGASPDMILAFGANEPADDATLPVSSPDPGDPHGPQAAV